MSERLVGILLDSFGKILLPGLTVTIPLTAISFTLALIIAVAVALVQLRRCRCCSASPGFTSGSSAARRCWCSFCRLYGLPGVGILIEPFPAAVLVFSINEGAYCAETIRAALESVPRASSRPGSASA